MKRLTMALLLLMVITALSLVACGGITKSDTTVSRETQQSVMARANAAIPAYQPQSFPAREDINWYLRETESRDNWYVYALNKEGLPMFYIVSSIKPRNLCVSLTGPDRVVGITGEPDLVLSAPALDGVYYGGANCGDTHYMRDVSTGNFIEISGQQFTLISSKVPLSLETDPLVFDDAE